ncbi:hypothetical protein B0H13DRAFT_2037884 [Mycena leptocephala]|nr:hypothetical protein B0H13DRAFT_2037884 [Mycena leptocephala]
MGGDLLPPSDVLGSGVLSQAQVHPPSATRCQPSSFRGSSTPHLPSPHLAGVKIKGKEARSEIRNRRRRRRLGLNAMCLCLLCRSGSTCTRGFGLGLVSPPPRARRPSILLLLSPSAARSSRVGVVSAGQNRYLWADIRTRTLPSPMATHTPPAASKRAHPLALPLRTRRPSFIPPAPATYPPASESLVLGLGRRALRNHRRHLHRLHLWLRLRLRLPARIHLRLRLLRPRPHAQSL